jgi:hypothetical protein
MTSLSSIAQKIAEIPVKTGNHDRVVNNLTRDCGEILPFQKRRNGQDFEQIRLAALKVSNGSAPWHLEALEPAKLDWRDLLEIDSRI